MTTPFQRFPEGSDRTVYVRPIAVSEIEAELPEEARSEMRQQLGGTEVIYSVHATNGQRLALVADRRLAFSLARAHELSAVSVH